jgi:hypothetical protein
MAPGWRSWKSKFLHVNVNGYGKGQVLEKLGVHYGAFITYESISNLAQLASAWGS